MMIPFNKPCIQGNELNYINETIRAGHLSGDGRFTKLCSRFFFEKYGFEKNLLTTSCTDALEMTAILTDIKSGDEIIAPSYTFVSTVNPFILKGANIIFVDSERDRPHINADEIEEKITSKTKIIVPVHYAGIACNMNKICFLAKKYNLIIVEDAAQAIGSTYHGKPLGSFGQFSTFSFHETKNVTCGEGGLLVINDEKYFNRAEIIREKGTNRSAFFRGEVDKYGWVDVGSSFLPSEISAAFLYAQLENLSEIQKKRKIIWESYYYGLKLLEDRNLFKVPIIPEYANNNYHIFYLICNNLQTRDDLMAYLKANNIHSVFHYQALHKSVFYKAKSDNITLPNSERYTQCLLRLPIYNEMTPVETDFIISKITEWINNRSLNAL